MSAMERNKGKLIPVNVDTEQFNNEDFEMYSENGFTVIGDQIYQVEWEVRQDTEEGFIDVDENEDGSISFHTYHYNGGAHWTEVVENALFDVYKEVY